MINRIIKIILASLLFIYSIYQFYEGHIGNGIGLIFLVSIVVLLIFRNEHVMLAFWYLRKNKLDKAQKALSRIKHPEQLLKKQEAYYYYLTGLIESQLQGVGKAEKFFKRALTLGLRMDQDKAVAKLNLAAIAMYKRRKREATTLLSEAKKLDKHNMLADQIKQLQQQMKKV
jgi:tetratricopeptide (TPR) repeat protein